MQIGEQLRQDAIGSWHRALGVPEPGSIRILRQDCVEDEAARHLLLEEIRRISTIEHPFLLRVRTHNATSARPWMFTEPIEGPSLAMWIAQNGPLDESEARALVDGLVDAMEHLEQRKQVHANVIAERIVRVGDGWRLLTFRDVRARDELKTLKGKRYPFPGWKPPERGKRHPAAFLPAAYDAWATGSILRVALGGGTPLTKTGEPSPLPQTFPTELRPVVEALTAGEPDRRPHGLSAVRRALAGEIVLAGGAAPEVAPPQAPISRRNQRRQ